MQAKERLIPVNQGNASSANGGSTHVRFTVEQFEKIFSDSEVSGESIPGLLKQAYFNGVSRVPLMRKDDAKMVINQLIKIGNNLNQVAYHLNSGFRAGFNDDLAEINRALTRLANVVTSTYRKGREEEEHSDGDRAM